MPTIVQLDSAGKVKQVITDRLTHRGGVYTPVSALRIWLVPAARRLQAVGWAAVLAAFFLPGPAGAQYTTPADVTLRVPARDDDRGYESGKRILTGTVDISGQPAGTSMKWKLESLNNKNVKIHGVALQWS